MYLRKISVWLLAIVLVTSSVTIPFIGMTAYATNARVVYAIEGIEYLGDYTKCQMNDKVAAAYADAIARMPSKENWELRVALLDPANCGIPVLYTVYITEYGGLAEDAIWHYDNGKAVKYDFHKDFQKYGLDDTVIAFRTSHVDGKAHIEARYQYTYSYAYDGCFYEITNGKLKLKHVINQEVVMNPIYDGLDPVAFFLDGKEYNSYEEIANVLRFGRTGDSIDISMHGTGDSECCIDLTEARKAIAVLQSYAKHAEGYTYPQAKDVDDAVIVKKITTAVKEELGGEIKGLYKLADGIYYVIVIVNDVEKGAVVCGVKDNGKIIWQIKEVHEKRASQKELDTILSKQVKKTNVKLDYSKLYGTKTKDVVTYIQGQLDNMEGTTPNDAAKAEISNYIESAISNSCGVAVKGKDNSLTIKGTVVSDLAEQALSAQKQYNDLLKANDVELNKKLIIMVRVLWQDMDNSKPCKIVLNEELLEALSGCDIQILLADSQHYIQISSKNLETLINDYGEVHIRVKKAANNIYGLKFYDLEGTEIEKLPVPMTFGMPAVSELSTVMASYSDKNSNWGGQFDPNTMSLAFDVRFGGTYEIIENELNIDDINDLGDESKKAISFMVSKGYMGLTNDLFQPGASLSRYEFAQALVGMFFALDPELKTNFEDVPEESEYYAYVASGEERAILEGFTEKTFGGDKKMTVEQMLAFAARTLVDNKGYEEPDDVDSLLNSFADSDDISDWAKSDVALAVREGLIDRGGSLNPGAEVTREQAAVILYRLFLLLYEVPKVEMELPPTEVEERGVDSPKAIALAVAGAGLAVAGAGGAVMVYRRRKG